MKLTATSRKACQQSNKAPSGYATDGGFPLRKRAVSEQFSKPTEILFYSIPVLLVFGVVYAFSTTFLYVEGDDAASVAFHALGRNSFLQHPYSPYHGMMDVFLRVLPADEVLLRHAAISITAVSAVLAVILALNLVYESLQLRGFKIVVITFLILFCVPEIFYLSLVYIPSYTALLFVLLAHKILRRFVISREGFADGNVSRRVGFVVSAIIFGMGAACRWDIGTYLIVIVADVLFGNHLAAARNGFSDASFFQNSFFRKVKLAGLYAASAVLFSIAAIVVSGYGLSDIFRIGKLVNNEVTGQHSIFVIVGAFQPFFTPAFLLFSAIGYAYLVLRKRDLAVFVFVSVSPFLIYVLSREPKMLLPALPGLLLAVAAGIDFVWFKMRNKIGLLAKAVAVLLIVCPWFVGVRVQSKDTLWGPAFDIKTVGRSAESEIENNVVADKVGDRSVAINRFAVTLDSGFAIPTGEGPRPIGGHFYALFGGRWKALIEKMDREKDVAIQKALSEGVPILQYGRNSDLVTKFSAMGYRTEDSYDAVSPDNIFIRKFTDGKNEVTIYAPSPPAAFFTKKMANNLIKLNCKKVILYSAYGSAMQKLYNVAPESMEAFGPITAMVNLEILIEKLPE